MLRGLKHIKLQKLHSQLDVNPFGKKFHIITMLDVLEHIKDDVGYLTKISNWLTKDGKLILTVPAYQWLWSGEDYVSKHVRRYSLKQLKDVIKESGYSIEKISYFNLFLFPFQVIILLLKRFFNPKSLKQTNLQELPKSINNLLTKIMSMESPFLLNYSFPFGGSIICICQK